MFFFPKTCHKLILTDRLCFLAGFQTLVASTSSTSRTPSTELSPPVSPTSSLSALTTRLLSACPEAVEFRSPFRRSETPDERHRSKKCSRSFRAFCRVLYDHFSPSRTLIREPSCKSAT